MSLGALGDYLAGWAAVIKKPDTPEVSHRQPFHCLVCDVWGCEFDPRCWVCGEDKDLEFKSIPGATNGHTFHSAMVTVPDLSVLTWRQLLDGVVVPREEAAR